MKKWLFGSRYRSQDIGLLIIRVGIGVLFLFHGYPKIAGGSQTWLWLGSQMKHLGITFGATFWGFAAACSEFFGGMALIVGLATRIAALLMGFVMFVALVFHVTKGDSFGHYAHPLSLLIVFIGLAIAGGGIYSLDYVLKN